MKKIIGISAIILVSACVNNGSTSFTQPLTEANKEDMQNYIVLVSFQPVAEACQPMGGEYSALPSMLESRIDKRSASRGKKLFHAGAELTTSGDASMVAGSQFSNGNYTQVWNKKYISQYKHEAKKQFAMLSQYDLKQMCNKLLSSF